MTDNNPIDRFLSQPPIVAGIRICPHCATENNGRFRTCYKCSSPLEPTLPEDVEYTAGETEGSVVAADGQDDRRDVMEEGSWLRVPCENCGHSSSDPETVFCPKCGGRVIDEETEAVTRRILNIVQSDVPTLVQSELANIDGFNDEVEAWAEEVEQRVQNLEVEARGPFSWKQVSDNEKWSVTWGVWWRTFVVGLMIQVGVIFVIMAVLGVIGNS